MNGNPSPPIASASANRGWRVVVGAAVAVVLWAGYALPLFFPPAQVACGAPIPPGATLLERLFPDVPPAWIGVRLLCVLAAAALVGAAVSRDVPAALPVQPRGAPPVRPAMWIALALAAGQWIAGVWAGEFHRPAQLFYIAALAAPALLLLIAYPPDARHRDRRTLLLLAAIAVLWAAWRVAVSIDSPRTADTVDTLGQLAMLQETENTGLNVLGGGALTGVPYLPFVFQGVGLFGPGGLPLTLPVLQLINVAWSALVAVGLGWITARVVSPIAAPVATAAFLFSPFMLLGPLVPIPMFQGVLIATGLLLLLLPIHERRSPPAIAAFGTLAGVGCSHPGTLPFTAMACAAALWSARRRPRVPRVMVAVALLCFAATIWPGLPSSEAVRSMQRTYARAANPWRALEYAVLGQLSPEEAQQRRERAEVGPLDTVLGTLLAPVAIPRTAIRLWGDALFDPLGAGLAMAAAVACMLALRRSVLARVLLAVLAVGLLPGVVSSYDRPSLTRMSIAPAGFALLAGLGFELVRRGLVGSWRPMVLAAGASVAIALGGALLFDLVTPRLLPASAFGLALESVGAGGDLDAVAVLDYPGWQYAWLGRVGHIAAVVRERPIRVVRYADPESLAAVDAERLPVTVLYWSPGLERFGGVAAQVCARWPAARVYAIGDRPGCSRVYAADLGGGRWRPAVAPERWSVRACGTGQ